MMTANKKIGFAGAAVLLFFGLIELLLRFAGFSFQPMTHHGKTFAEHFEAEDEEHYQQDPARFWMLKKSTTLHASWTGEKGASITSLGTRGAEPARPKPPGTFRILCLGDSGTFGWSVEDDQTYPAALEKRLNSWDQKPAGIRYEVINAGVNGYTTYQSIETYKQLDELLKPDLITISTGRNDFVCLPVSDPDRPKMSEWQLPMNAMLSKLRLGQLLLWTAQQLHANEDRSKWVNRVSPLQFKSLMTGLIDDCASKNRRVAFIIRGGYNDLLNEFKLQKNLIFVDFKRWDEIGEVRDFMIGGHPDADTYRVIAEAIFIELHQSGAL
jgi:lysophospholipase L1-like esterase